MKPFKKIAILFCFVAGIVAFWLMPGINKATDTTYTRLYEDTDASANPKDTNRYVVKAAPTKTVEVTLPKIQYKRESIRSKAKIKDITPKMFSRAVQFEPEVVLIDTVSEEKIVVDSSKVIQ